ncbi:MAG TPA: DUF3084 domain-containing protein [Verrucomicrobiae bacterium]|nr:DUF3084 domain-containing protein [Verrucomicrobiae bacterium]
MNLVEIVRGIGNVLLVMVIAGGVAYVGDRVGHQVGRKRLTLFNIRPRYTSTIIAIATGMVIALVVTLVAIFASQEVKTAFFKLSSINAQIEDLQSRERDLEKKVNTGRLVVRVDELMVPYTGIIPQGATAAQRLTAIQEYYASAVRYVNSTWTRNGLKPYTNPPDIDRRLHGLADDMATEAKQAQANLMLTVTADQNLFAGDPIHFQLNALPDVKAFGKGDPIYTLTIPGNSGASAELAISELQNAVSAVARAKMPAYLAESVTTLQLIPSLQQMQAQLAKRGSYLMTAYAAYDVYPHLGGIPIIVVLTQQPGT